MQLLHEKVPLTHGGRLLGANIAFGRNVRNDIAEKRVQRGVVVAERIRWAPLPMPIRARLLSSLVLLASLYAVCVGDLSTRLLNRLTSAVMRAVWGTKRKLRSRDVVLSLLVPGHLVDPRQAFIHQTLCTLRQSMHKHLELLFANALLSLVVHGQSLKS